MLNSRHGIRERELFFCGMENDEMNRVDRYVFSLLLGAALGAPVFLAVLVPQEDAVRDKDAHDERVYGKDHNDYQRWDEHQNEAWKRFLVENHRNDQDFSKASEKEQTEYWDWRQAHPD